MAAKKEQETPEEIGDLTRFEIKENTCSECGTPVTVVYALNWDLARNGLGVCVKDAQALAKKKPPEPEEPSEE